MLLKGGILPVMAILTSLHSYGANFTQNGTASATMNAALSFSNVRNIYLGSFVIKKDSTSLNTVTGSGLQLYKNGTVRYASYVDWVTPPYNGLITVNGVANRSIAIALTNKSALSNSQGDSMGWDLHVFIPSSSNSSPFTNNATPKSTTLGTNGTLLLTLGGWYRPNANAKGTYTGTYTIDVTYV